MEDKSGSPRYVEEPWSDEAEQHTIDGCVQKFMVFCKKQQQQQKKYIKSLARSLHLPERPCKNLQNQSQERINDGRQTHGYIPLMLL